MTERNTLQVDEFVRSINVNKDSPHALFLGAGASLSSGVPSAGKCVSQWKRDIYVTNNPSMKDLVAEQSIIAVQDRIDRWLRENGHWPAKGEDDYCFFYRALPQNCRGSKEVFSNHGRVKRSRTLDTSCFAILLNRKFLKAYGRLTSIRLFQELWQRQHLI